MFTFNFNKLKKGQSLPDSNMLASQPYLQEFLQNQTALFKSRVRLLCFLVIGIYFATTAIDWLFRPQDVSVQELPVAGLLLLACVVILYLNHRVRSLTALKLNTYLFIALIIALLTKVNVIYYEYAGMASTVYLVLLFLVSFTLPWKSREVVPIIILHYAAFTLLFLFLQKNALLYGKGVLDALDFKDGLILLATGSVFCLVMRRKEYRRDTENFILLREVQEKNEQMRKELELATQVQKTLVPKSISTDMVDVAVLYLPMYYMGGDYAKFHFVDKDKLIFIICDITGHGVSAALLVNRLHAEFERLVKECSEPGVLLSHLNSFITREFKDINMYLSAFCCLLDYKVHKLTYSNHGHPPQYIYRVRESCVDSLDSQASLLGIPLAQEGIFQRDIPFDKGDRLMLFTDGLIETKGKDGAEFGKEKIEQFIRENHALDVGSFNHRLLEELNHFKRDKFEDDIFVLNIQIK
jgi:sigma-B regulation protein RsbU (phosphoserine phosphatase)